MLVVIAYVLVMLLGQYGPLLGLVVASPLAFLLLWAPPKVRVLIGGFVAGVIGPLITFAFAAWLFTKLGGQGAFGVLPFLTAALSLALPIRNDLRKYRELRKIQAGESATVASIAEPDVLVHSVTVVGNLVGMVAAALWFFAQG